MLTKIRGYISGDSFYLFFRKFQLAKRFPGFERPKVVSGRRVCAVVLDDARTWQPQQPADLFRDLLEHPARRRLRDRIATAQEREHVLTSEISEVTTEIRALEDDVTSATARLATVGNRGRGPIVR